MPPTDTAAGDHSPYSQPFLLLCIAGTLAFMVIMTVKDPYDNRRDR